MRCARLTGVGEAYQVGVAALGGAPEEAKDVSSSALFRPAGYIRGACRLTDSNRRWLHKHDRALRQVVTSISPCKIISDKFSIGRGVYGWSSKFDYTLNLIG